MDHLQHQPLPLIHLHLPTHHRSPTPERPLPTTRPQITQLQITIVTTGATTQHGTTRRMLIAAIIHLTVKVVLEINIAKAILDPALQHTTPPDRAGKHYTIAEYFEIQRVPQ